MGAAGAAIWLEDLYGAKLDSALANGWLARATRMLQHEDESSAHGWIIRAQLRRALGTGDFDEALGHAARMLEIGVNLGDRDLQAITILYEGNALLNKGQTSEGIALVEEAAVAAISGELEPLATAIIYCNAISACRSLADYRRAGEWTSAAKRWCERQAIAGFPGVCRVNRAEIMRLHGGTVKLTRGLAPFADEQ